MRDSIVSLSAWLWARLLEEDGFSRIWYGLATAMVIVGGGLIYNQATGGGGGCALPSYPDVSCTGYPSGQSFTSSAGVTITTNNATYDGYHFTGSVFINATNVTIRNSWIENDDQYALTLEAGASATVEDTEIECGDLSGTKGAFIDWFSLGITFSRDNIHGCEDGIYASSTFILEDSYIHNLATGGPNPDPHNDGVQTDGANGYSIVHNFIYGSDTSAIGNCNDPLGSNCSGMANILIDSNLLAGAGWTLYCPRQTTSNFVVSNNHWLNNTWAFGPNTDCTGEIDGGGNQIQETGTPVSLNT